MARVELAPCWSQVQDVYAYYLLFPFYCLWFLCARAFWNSCSSAVRYIFWMNYFYSVLLLLLLVQYVMERNGDTLLPQFLGMYRITVKNSKTHLVVMCCVFSPLFSIHCKYDLKARQCCDVSIYTLSQKNCASVIFWITPWNANQF